MGVRRRSSQRQRQRATTSEQENAETARSIEATTKVARSKSQSDAVNIVATFEDVFAAVESLYVDELKPFGRILRKRVAEHAALASGVDPICEANLPHVNINQLHATCNTRDSLHMEPEEGGDWSVIIIGRQQTFVNVYSPLDPYPASMWTEAAAYLQGLNSADMYLPGGRYSCAQSLQARRLSCLRAFSLGAVCHIVQLAISQKKLLGYLNGSVVPYAHSQSMVKESCAHLNAPCTAKGTANAGVPTTGNNLTMATWEVARQCLKNILQNSASTGTVGMVPLSNVKRLFRSRYQTELSETLLGHSKLSDLLQDERFADICNVELQGNGYIVMQVQCQMDEDHAVLPANQLCLQEPLTLDIDMDGVVLESTSSPKVRKTWWRPSSGDGFAHSLVQRTFIHASLPPPTPPPNARQRSASLPKYVGSQFLYEPLSVQMCHTEAESTVDSTASGSVAQAPSRSPTPSDSCRSEQLEEPVKFLLRQCDLGTTTQPMKIGDPQYGDTLGFIDAEDEPRRRPMFCLDEPLSLEEAGVFLESLESAPYIQTPTSVYGQPSPALWSIRTPTSVYGQPSPSPWSIQTPTSVYGQPSPAPWPCLPSSLAFDGCVGSIPLSKIHKTFIHSPLPPPTPFRGDASRRSRSLPKEFGSDKNAWETTCQALGCSHIAVSRWGCEVNASDSLPTPSVYADYTGCSISAYAPAFATSPAFVPPSPALTASPTYCSSRNGRRTHLLFGLPAEIQPPMSNVIQLADLLQ